MRAMRFAVLVFSLFSLASFISCSSTHPKSSANSDKIQIDFESMKAGEKPADFEFARTGEGRPSVWRVDHFEGRNALLQADLDSEDYCFPVAVYSKTKLADVEVSTKYKAASGEIDQVGGVVCRYSGPDRYYIARANALEHNVRLYHVIGSKRTQIANWTGEVKANVWHELALRAKGDRLSVLFDGKIVIDIQSSAITEPGMAGVWTKSDSKTYFDELVISALR